MNSVGCMYVRGIGVAVNPETASMWFTRSAEDSDPEGMYHLATLMDDRITKTKNRLLMHRSGRDETYRTSVVRTMREIERLLLDASNLGHAGAMNALGSLYEHADAVGTAGVTRDSTKALYWYQKSAELEFAVAQNNMGSFCYVGKPPMRGPDYNQAREWFEKAAEQSDPVALNNLGICYELGRGGVTQDLTKASALYAQSASQGNPSAMNNWGFMLVKRAEASGSTSDSASFRRAALLFRCAVQTDGGWPEDDGSSSGSSLMEMDGAYLSASDFSHMFSGAGSSSSSAYHSNHHSSSGSGSGSSTMTASERKHRRTELRQTNADACFNLATLYEAGYGVERDLQAAYGYYRRAADNPDRPHPKAACRTAAMLYSGTYRGSDVTVLSMNETSRNKTKRLASALKYYKKAAKLGDAEAENALGIMIEELGDVTYGNDTKTQDTEDTEHKHGNGDIESSSSSFSSIEEPRFLGRDPIGAGLWYRRAAFNGNPYALLNLARLYSEGKGVEQNVSYASKLLQQAAAAGVVQAEIELTQLEKSVARGDVSGSPIRSPHRFLLDPSKPDIKVRVITEEEKKNRSRTPSPTRKYQRDSKIDTDTDSTQRSMTTPQRQRNGESKNVIGSPFTEAAEERLEKLKLLLATSSV